MKKIIVDADTIRVTYYKGIDDARWAWKITDIETDRIIVSEKAIPIENVLSFIRTIRKDDRYKIRMTTK